MFFKSPSLFLRSIFEYLNRVPGWSCLTLSFIFFRSIVVYLKLGSRLTLILPFWLTCPLTCSLTYRLPARWHFYWHVYSIFIDFCEWHLIHFHWHLDRHLHWHVLWHFCWHVCWHFIDILTDMFIGIYIDTLTAKKEGEGRRKEGRSGLLLNI